MMLNLAYYDEDVRPSSGADPVCLYSDIDISSGATARAVATERLGLAIQRLPSHAEAQGLKRELSQLSLAAARAFIGLLPTNRALPRVGADEDGDVFLVWDTPTGVCELTLAGMTLYMVINPGSRSTHIPQTTFDGGHIPPSILQHIPRG